MRPTVMIICDDSVLGHRFKAALVENGLDATIFSKPSVGLNELKLSSQKYSLVLIDFTSQVKNSTRNFPKQVKDINDKIKIILISGFHFNESYISRQGYDQYLKLPVTMSKFVNLIKETLARQSLDPIFG
jgi:two-component SAPR family response regulator